MGGQAPSDADLQQLSALVLALTVSRRHHQHVWQSLILGCLEHGTVESDEGMMGYDSSSQVRALPFRASLRLWGARPSPAAQPCAGKVLTCFCAFCGLRLSSCCIEGQPSFRLRELVL